MQVKPGFKERKVFTARSASPPGFFIPPPMAKDKKSFVLYCDQRQIFNELSNEEAGMLIKHIFSYTADENPTAESRLIKIAFEPIKQQLKRDLVKYEAVRERNSTNAKKRWNAKNATACDRIPNDAKNADNDNDNDNVKRESIQESPPADLSKSNLFRQPKIPTKQQVLESFLNAGGTKEMARTFYLKHEAT